MMETPIAAHLLLNERLQLPQPPGQLQGIPLLLPLLSQGRLLLCNRLEPPDGRGK